MRRGSLTGENGTGCLDRSHETQEQKGERAYCQDDQQPRCREYLVGPVQSAELADRGLLRPEDSATTQEQEDSRDR